jgi:hypothetical protein
MASRSLVAVFVAVFVAVLAVALAGCASPPASAPDRLADRAARAPRVVDDQARAARAQSALQGMHDAAVAIESGVERARVDILALHHDPNATPEDFRAALEAMRQRHAPLIESLLESRAEAASSTTAREWNELIRD